MRSFKRILFSGLLSVVAVTALSAQELDDATAGAATGGSVSEVSAAEPEPTSPMSAEEKSRVLKENLQATIDEGERVLKTLPRERLRILRSRVSNLERQLKKKERERKQLNDSLANLRADYFRRLSALRGDQKQTSGEIEAEELRLKSDYDLHAEFFEDEVVGLNRDMTEIKQTIKKLRVKTEIEERLQPRPKIRDREPLPSDRVDGIPDALNPFEFKSYVPRLRGEKTAPRAEMLGLRAEVAYHQGEIVRAAAAFEEILAERRLDPALREMTIYNRAYMEYLEGNYPRAYGIFREHFSDDLTPESAHVLAVLAYMNGFMEDTRSYLQKTDVSRRRKLELVLGPISPASLPR